MQKRNTKVSEVIIFQILHAFVIFSSQQNNIYVKAAFFKRRKKKLSVCTVGIKKKTEKKGKIVCLKKEKKKFVLMIRRLNRLPAFADISPAILIQTLTVEGSCVALGQFQNGRTKTSFQSLVVEQFLHVIKVFHVKQKKNINLIFFKLTPEI